MKKQSSQSKRFGQWQRDVEKLAGQIYNHSLATETKHDKMAVYIEDAEAMASIALAPELENL